MLLLVRFVHAVIKLRLTFSILRLRSGMGIWVDRQEDEL